MDIDNSSDSAFAQDGNEKSELTNAVAAVDSDYRYAYDFDDIGNRETSSERVTNFVYAANQLMEIYISKIVWAGFVALIRYGLGNRIARIISKHEEYR